MFQKAVSPEQLLLLEELSSRPFICQNFYLAGGTALALLLGHRKSFDLDFFSEKGFDINLLKSALLPMKVVILREEQDSIDAIVNKIKLSFFYYPYKILDDFWLIKKINIAKIHDIACMKAVAISQRGKKKDFYDFYEILKKISPLDLKRLFIEKYGKSGINCYHILKSFFYFDDAEKDPDPASLTGITWKEVKKYFLDNEKELFSSLLC